MYSLNLQEIFQVGLVSGSLLTIGGGAAFCAVSRVAF